ncbi:MAG TPA: hypothetical protein DEP45_04680 [Armatimonadetes bacterium]|nr:hypothetical protein [Armatimonadota bacterium]
MTESDRNRSDGALEVGVRFRHNPKVYSFSAADIRVGVGEKVLVRSEKGVDMGEVIELKGRVPQERADQLMPVLRKATAEDLAHIEEQEQRERQALDICAEKIAEHNLPMKLIDASLSFDNTRLVFFFSAEGRVDFRELVRDLAKTFRLRIELRQIGVRDEAKLLGGLGPCGRRLCCKSFMREFEPVGIRVAKDQGLALNPNKISGLCDRLMCCLLFEHNTYCALRNELPSRGERVMTEKGPGVVREVMLLKEQVLVHLEDGTELAVKVCQLRPAGEPAPSPAPEAEAPAEEAAAVVEEEAPAQEAPQKEAQESGQPSRRRGSRGRRRSRSKSSGEGGGSGQKQPKAEQPAARQPAAQEASAGQAQPAEGNPQGQQHPEKPSGGGEGKGRKRSSRRRGGRRKPGGQQSKQQGKSEGGKPSGGAKGAADGGTS